MIKGLFYIFLINLSHSQITLNDKSIIRFFLLHKFLVVNVSKRKLITFSHKIQYEYVVYNDNIPVIKFNVFNYVIKFGSTKMNSHIRKDVENRILTEHTSKLKRKRKLFRDLYVMLYGTKADDFLKSSCMHRITPPDQKEGRKIGARVVEKRREWFVWVWTRQ